MTDCVGCASCAAAGGGASSRAAPKTLQQWVVRVRAQACGLCAPCACLRCARTSRHRCTWPPCARLPARAVSSVCSCSFVVGPTSMVKALARLRRRRPPSRPVCRRLCGRTLRDRTLCDCALCDCALRDCVLCATMLLRMFALLCDCALRDRVLCATMLLRMFALYTPQCYCAGLHCTRHNAIAHVCIVRARAMRVLVACVCALRAGALCLCRGSPMYTLLRASTSRRRRHHCLVRRHRSR